MLTEMTDAKIRDMLSDIVQELDYDIWKDYFSAQQEDPEDRIQDMMCVVKDHLDIKHGV